MSLYFPQKFDNSTKNNYYANLRMKIEIDIQALIDPSSKERNKQKVKEINEFFNKSNKPKCFDRTADNFVIYQEQSFEELVCVMEDNGTVNAKKLTTFEFFKRAEYCEIKYRPKS